MIRFVARTAIAAATLVAFAAPAFAHITLETGQAKLGSTYKAIFRVPHGCAGAATTAIHVQIPAGFISVKPQPKAGWKLDVTTGAHDSPIDNNGTPVTEGVTEVVWSGGELPDAFYDEFVLRGTFVGSLPTGKFFFPVVQECGSAEEAWINISGDESKGEPAPSLELLPADAETGHH